MTEFETRSATLRERRQGLAPLSFNLCIDEPQRLALLGILAGAKPDEFLGDGGALEYWVEMLEGLPKEEDEQPGTVHGFCL